MDGFRAEVPMAEKIYDWRKHGTSAIPVGGLNISSKCLAACTYCIADAKATDKQMEWSLFEALLASESIRFSDERVILGDGEVIIYNQSGRNLGHAVGKLLEIPNLNVGFITAGLIPTNREIGLEAFKVLETLTEEQKSRLDMRMSFNLFQKIDHDVYIAAVKETMDVMRALFPAQTKINLIYDYENMQETYDIFYGLPRAGEFDVRAWHVIPSIGRAAKNTKHSRFAGEANDNISCKYQKWSSAEFAINPNGDIGLHCCMCIGARGISVGNVHRNSAEQVHESFEKFPTEFMEMRKSKKGAHTCEACRTWGKKLAAPASKAPIIRI